MSMSGAERQAKYRERQKTARHVSAEEAVEAERRRLAGDFMRDATDDAAMTGMESDAAAAMIARVCEATAQPLWPAGEFDVWVERVLVREIEGQISMARCSQRRRR